jgi:TIR domain
MGTVSEPGTGAGTAEGPRSSSEMPPTILQRALQLGFQYPVFLSWPHCIQTRGREIVQALASALEDVFKDDGGAKVFLDTARIKPSYQWDPFLRTSLARSAVIFAFLLPSYFESPYCRIEWNIGEQLQQLRLKGHVDRSVVIPILLSGHMNLPREVKAIQFDDEFQQLLVWGADVTTHNGWRKLVNRLRDQVFEILEILCESPRDWAEEEKIAQNAGPKAFNWIASKAAFPRLVAE